MGLFGRRVKNPSAAALADRVADDLMTILDVVREDLTLPGVRILGAGGRRMSRGEFGGQLRQWSLGTTGAVLETSLPPGRLVLPRPEEIVIDALTAPTAAVVMDLDTARLLADSRPRAADQVSLDGDPVDQLKVVADEHLADVRVLASAARPHVLDEVGLVPALRRWGANLRDKDAAAFPVEFDMPALLQQLPRQIELSIYRVVTEALTNTVLHSGARTAEVRITFNDHGDLSATVTDRGHGIGAEPSGTGITMMRARVEKAGGRFTFQSTPKGVRVEAWFRSDRL